MAENKAITNKILLTKDVLRKDYLGCYNSTLAFDIPNIDSLLNQEIFLINKLCME